MPFPTGPRYPDFICIGAQKAGTTWLHQKLSQHPKIWLPALKEVHYFDAVHEGKAYAATIGASRQTAALRSMEWTLRAKLSPEEKLDRIDCLVYSGLRTLSDEWYGNLFRRAPADAICGEITPEYALLPDKGVAHIVRLQPGIKIILIMRDPIDRAWSALRMIRKRTRRGDSSERQPQSGGMKLFERSNYMATIERYRRFLPVSNILLLFFDDIEKAPRNLLRSVCDFIGVEFREENFKGLFKKKNEGEPDEIDPATYQRLRDELRPIYDTLVSLESDIPRDWYRRHYGAQ
jgi:hypothetical protein